MKQTRILIAQDSSPKHHAVTRGIQNALLAQTGCKLASFNPLKRDEEKLEDILKWKPHGLLSLYRYEQFPELFHLEHVTAVLIDTQHEQPEGVSQVNISYRGIGCRAAEYFLGKHFRTLGVAMSHALLTSMPSMRERHAGFIERLAEAGISPYRFEVKHTGVKPWYTQKELLDWLRELPKPIGIYCGQDVVALRILEHCEQLGIKVPSEVSLLGTDNEVMWCEAMRPFISSIYIPYFDAGKHAARMVWNHIQYTNQHQTPPIEKVTVHTGEIVERQSTSLRMVPDPAIAKAVTFLLEYGLQGGTIDEAARAGGLNRRTMERGFQKHLGVTPKQFLDQHKTDHAKRLLTETDVRIYEVAEACRFPEDYFVTFFKRQTCLTPLAYRKKYKVSIPNAG